MCVYCNKATGLAGIKTCGKLQKHNIVLAKALCQGGHTMSAEWSSTTLSEAN